LRLVERQEFRRNPAKAAEKGLHWGSPVLESALTLIENGRLFYRGIDAIELAGRSTLEEVAALLWTGDASRASALFAEKSFAPPGLADLLERAPRLGPVERCQLILPLAASADLAAYDLRPNAVAKTGARILRLVFSAVVGFAVSGALDGALVRAWTPRRKSLGGALGAALIVCADHELNVSAFTARCVASALATPYEVVIGALAAFRGRRHGGVSQDVQLLFREARETGDCRAVVASRLRSLGYVPGFGHALYPAGDPRARKLISLAKAYGKPSLFELANSLARAAHNATGEHPNLDFGLTTFAHALQLSGEAPMAIFALGRTVGWIAQAIEQYEDGQLIRPRARYTGPAPADS